MNCPICKKPSAEKYRPFCSKRCADVDLGRWMTESYTIEATDLSEETPAELKNEPQTDSSKILH